MEESFDILKSHPKISAVMCREEGQGHMYRSKDCPFLECRGIGFSHWGYYSFNPGLRRKQDVLDVVGQFQNVTIFDPKRPAKAEEAINAKFRDAGFRLAMTTKGYVKHLGDSRHVGENLNEKQKLCEVQ